MGRGRSPLRAVGLIDFSVKAFWVSDCVLNEAIVTKAAQKRRTTKPSDENQRVFVACDSTAAVLRRF